MSSECLNIGESGRDKEVHQALVLVRLQHVPRIPKLVILIQARTEDFHAFLPDDSARDLRVLLHRRLDHRLQAVPELLWVRGVVEVEGVGLEDLALFLGENGIARRRVAVVVQRLQRGKVVAVVPGNERRERGQLLSDVLGGAVNAQVQSLVVAEAVAAGGRGQEAFALDCALRTRDLPCPVLSCADVAHVGNLELRGAEETGGTRIALALARLSVHETSGTGLAEVSARLRVRSRLARDWIHCSKWASVPCWACDAFFLASEILVSAGRAKYAER